MKDVDDVLNNTKRKKDYWDRIEYCIDCDKMTDKIWRFHSITEERLLFIGECKQCHYKDGYIFELFSNITPPLDNDAEKSIKDTQNNYDTYRYSMEVCKICPVPYKESCNCPFGDPNVSGE